MTLDETIVDRRFELHSFALSLTHNGDAAKDLVNDTILRALENRDKYVEGTNAIAWLMTIMKRHFVGEKRRLRNRNEMYLGEYEDKRVQPSTQLLHVELKETFAAMQRLRPRARKILETLAPEGTEKDVAALLGSPIGTAKSSTSRARAALNKELSKHG